MPKIYHTRFRETSPYGLVSETANKSVKSRCNGIWETTRHNRLVSAPTY